MINQVSIHFVIWSIIAHIKIFRVYQIVYWDYGNKQYHLRCPYDEGYKFKIPL